MASASVPPCFYVCGCAESDMDQIKDALTDRGYRWIFHPWRTQPKEPFDLGRHAGLILLGDDIGEPDDEKEFAYEIAWARLAHAQNKPALGICHGAQMMAGALGGKVLQRSRFTDKGLIPVVPTPEGIVDPVTRHLGPSHPMCQWHKYIFAPPLEAVKLANSGGQKEAHCDAFRMGETTYALMFHPEVGKGLLPAWVHKSKVDQETMNRIPKINRAILDAWLDRAIASRSADGG